jgi:hypothetical protein
LTLGFLVLVLAFTFSVLSGIRSLLIIGYVVGVGAYMLFSGGWAYDYCVTRNIDEIIGDPTAARAYSKARARLMHSATAAMLERKTAVVARERVQEV